MLLTSILQKNKALLTSAVQALDFKMLFNCSSSIISSSGNIFSRIFCFCSLFNSLLKNDAYLVSVVQGLEVSEISKLEEKLDYLEIKNNIIYDILNCKN